MKTKTKHKISYRTCPFAHTLLSISLIIVALFFALRNDTVAMRKVCNVLVRPYHKVAGSLFSKVSFSVAELFYVLVVIAVIAIVVCGVKAVIFKTGIAAAVYSSIIRLSALGLAIYAGICMFWGVYYSVSDFSEENGIKTGEYSVDELYDVTLYFASVANRYSGLVPRDYNGVYCEDLDSVFSDAVTVYDSVSKSFPSLQSPSMHPKPLIFSKLMSIINFTGFFFPFTGEANINVDCPGCMIPSTIVHEIAHQRGVASEDEANFVAVLAGLESGNEVYIYSCSLLAYIHLGNALYKADNALWKEVYYSLNETVRADLRLNNDYWNKYETKSSDIAEAVYTEILEGYGEERGMQSYGDCIDLLIAYYHKDAVMMK